MVIFDYSASSVWGDPCGIPCARIPIRLTARLRSQIKTPATSLHNVTPLTRGSRIASFFWIQSLIRNVSQRALLFDLDMAIIRLTHDHPEHPSVVQLTAIYHNLLRQWAEA